MPVQIDIVPAIALLITALGGGAGVAKIVEVWRKLKAGMSAKEENRKDDISKQRDAAVLRADASDDRARATLEYASRLKRQLIEAGVEPHPEPEFTVTLSAEEIKALRESMKKTKEIPTSE